jgi:8-oxo-dGTP pyrophosphatase MutT (NUDIX family)
MIEKVCPVLLRHKGRALEVLAFRHPLAGLQLVKGTREPGESVASGALREMREEAGVAADDPRVLCTTNGMAADQIWHFVLVSKGDLPDGWSFYCPDDGGHLFEFFWWNLWEAPGAEWHPIFERALDTIVTHLVEL